MKNDLDHLRGLFRAILEGLGEMHGLLDREAVALGARDAEELGRIAARKQALVPVLDRLAAAQGQCLGGMGGGEGAASVEAFLSRSGVAGAAVESALAEWREIQRLLQACKRQNEANGAYIALLRRHVEAALSILMGPAYPEATYGPDGAQRRGVYSRRSFSA
jgi:flagellar biosynthesis/type III secretory pathway chaperone